MQSPQERHISPIQQVMGWRDEGLVRFRDAGGRFGLLVRWLREAVEAQIPWYHQEEYEHTWRDLVKEKP